MGVYKISKWDTSSWPEIKGIMIEIKEKKENLCVIMSRLGARGISMDTLADETGVISTFYPFDDTDLEQQLTRGSRGVI